MPDKSHKRLVRRARADLDVLEALDHYLGVSVRAADGFVDALERAYAHIRGNPSTGSPRYGHELNLPGLRFWACARYPYLVFYIELEGRIEVWRVLHDQRDIARWLREGADPLPE